MRLFAAVGVLLSLYACSAHADTFGSGVNVFDVEFVTIGNPDNMADTTGMPNPAGAVRNTYRIAKFEISEALVAKANILGGLNITKDTRGLDKPATSISWFEAATFVNWLNISSNKLPAYKFDSNGALELWQAGDIGFDPDNLFRNSLAKYFLPSVDEWYKAAYYDPATAAYFNFPTGSNFAPTAVASSTAPHTAVRSQSTLQGPADVTQAGGLSPFGTMGQGGNVYEWEETEHDLSNNAANAVRGLRGGAWGFTGSTLHALDRSGGNPTGEDDFIGFRVASLAIPEPSALTLCWLGTTSLFLSSLRHRRRGVEPNLRH